MKTINHNEFYTVKVTQYLMPDGRQKQITTRLLKTSEKDYLDMLKAGYYFEIEMLRTGLISVTITKDEDDIDIEVIPNGHEVQEAMAKMLGRRVWEEDDAIVDNFSLIIFIMPVFCNLNISTSASSSLIAFFNLLGFDIISLSFQVRDLPGRRP